MGLCIGCSFHGAPSSSHLPTGSGSGSILPLAWETLARLCGPPRRWRKAQPIGPELLWSEPRLLPGRGADTLLPSAAQMEAKSFPWGR